MPAVSLYRKWRPQTFSDVVGQDHITTTLMNAIRANRIAHAYLFTGPRGTGKTTTARIFAKAINCTFEDDSQRPCNQCAICVSITEARNLDLIEIDAASNNSVDDVRELRDRIGLSPSQSRFKVYIIDEVHMLSQSAFNALLKTLEEPPAHAIFILATTEVDKLPATVLSRCQRFDFRFVPFRLVREQLAMIAEAEGAQIEAGALDLFARQAGGSMRDGISLLDQMIAYGDGQVTLAQAQTILGSVASQSVGQLANCIVARDVSGGLQLINQVISDGADPRQFLRELLEYLRGLLLLRGSPDGHLLNLPAEIIGEMKAQSAALPTADLLLVIKSFSQALNQLRNSPQPQLPIEVAFVEAALRGTPSTASEKAPPAAEGRESSALSAPASTPPAPSRDARPPAAAVPQRPSAERPRRGAPEPEPSAPKSGKSKPAAAPDPKFDALQAQWDNVLAAVKARNRSLEAVLKSGRPVGLEDDVLVLGFPYEFHKSKVEEAKNKSLLEEVLNEVTQTLLRVRCDIVKAERKPLQLRPKDKNQQAMEDPLVKEVVTKYNARIAQVDDEPPEEE